MLLTSIVKISPLGAKIVIVSLIQDGMSMHIKRKKATE